MVIRMPQKIVCVIFVKSIAMDPTFKVNCYCFNKHCTYSIFHSGSYRATTIPLQDVLIRPYYCEVCREELICKPLLHVQRQLDILMLKRVTI